MNEESNVFASRDHTSTTIYVPQAAWDASLASAQSLAMQAANGHNGYARFCQNCMDFADHILQLNGFARYSIGDFVSGVVLDLYAIATQYICITPYDDLMANLNGEVDDWFDALDWLFDIWGGSEYQDYIEAMNELFDVVGSPIALDLDGNGLKTTSYATRTVVFDVSGDGRADRTAWLDPGDGFLACDVNLNGMIDGVDELFGGQLRGEGYTKLAGFDSNGDGMISSADSRYGSLLVWQDVNSDGISDVGELSLLSDLGITSIGLDYDSVERFDHGNLIGEVSTFSMNGETREAGDIYFRYSVM